MLRRLFKRKMKMEAALFMGHYIDVRALYVMEFDSVCCISFIGEVDTGRAFTRINETMGAEFVNVYQHSFYNHEDMQMQFNNTIIVLTGSRMIELGGNYCQILHTPGQYNWANDLIRELAGFRVQERQAVGFARQTATN